MLVPKLRFKEFNDEWESKIMNKFFNIIMGQSPQSENYTTNSQDTILIQGNADLSNGKIIPRLYTTQITKKCNENDIIMTVRAPVGDLAITKYNACIGRGVCAIKGNEFLYYNLQIFKQNNGWRKLSKGSTIDSITSDDIKNLLLNYPTVLEQNKIANFLSLLDKKIELQSKKIEILKLYKKGIIYSLGKKQKKWDKYKIKDIFNITRGIVIPKNILSVKCKDDYVYPVYSSQTFNNGILGYDKDYSYNGKYLTWTTDGANAGRVFYRNGKFKCTNVCGILYDDNKRFTNELVAELLNYETPKHVSYIGNPKLMNNVMAEIEIFLPDIDIQKQVSLLLKMLNKKISKKTIKLTKINQLKKGLMQNMFV
ncbi:MAG: restriction endonuclease subunit S [Bacilli bacterium]